MTLFCKNCVREFLENPIEHEDLLLTLRKKTKGYTLNNIELGEVGKKLN